VAILSKLGVLQQKEDVQFQKCTAILYLALQHKSHDQVERLIAETDNKIKKAAKDLDFISAAQFRDGVLALRERLK
jgi:excinuclease UvrABC helicase subunit UvrB